MNQLKVANFVALASRADLEELPDFRSSIVALIMHSVFVGQLSISTAACKSN